MTFCLAVQVIYIKDCISMNAFEDLNDVNSISYMVLYTEPIYICKAEKTSSGMILDYSQIMNEILTWYMRMSGLNLHQICSLMLMHT